MEKFVRLTGSACPINQTNVNTDQILPARYLKWTRAMGIGKVLFQDLRFDANGNEKPEFPINRPAWKNAKFVVAARNFGCGSSREAAVYALYDYGVRCVIAPSFGQTVMLLTHWRGLAVYLLAWALAGPALALLLHALHIAPVGAAMPWTMPLCAMFAFMLLATALVVGASAAMAAVLQARSRRG